LSAGKKSLWSYPESPDANSRKINDSDTDVFLYARYPSLKSRVKRDYSGRPRPSPMFLEILAANSTFPWLLRNSPFASLSGCSSTPTQFAATLCCTRQFARSPIDMRGLGRVTLTEANREMTSCVRTFSKETVTDKS
jgi:hypothetical protein